MLQDGRFVKPLWRSPAAPRAAWRQQTAFHCVLALGAYWGAVTRVALEHLTTFSGSYCGGVVWANFAACAVMGSMAYSSDTGLWNQVLTHPNLVYSARGKHPLYAGVTTGFCGTLSLFSSVALELFTYTFDLGETRVHSRGYGAVQFFEVLAIELAVLLAGLRIGQQIARWVEAHQWQVRYHHATWGVYVAAWCGVAATVAVVVVTITVDSSREYLFACVFAPAGCFLRFHLLKLNRPGGVFMMGTFAANTFAGAVLAVVTLVSRGTTIHTSHLQHQVLAGIADGFCGALSTVSTFVVELRAISAVNAWSAWVYGAVSLLVSFALMVLILGLYAWTHALA